MASFFTTVVLFYSAFCVATALPCEAFFTEAVEDHLHQQPSAVPQGHRSLLVTLTTNSLADPFSVLEDEFDLLAAHSLMQSGATRSTLVLPSFTEFGDAFAGLLDTFADSAAGPSLPKEAAAGGVSRRFWSTVALDLALFGIILGMVHVMRLQLQREKVPISTKALSTEETHEEVLDSCTQAQSVWVQLIQAIRAGEDQKCCSLLERNPSQASHEDEFGCTALHVAADCGSTSVAEALLRHGADAHFQDSWEETALHLAARRGHVAMCELLIRAGADVNALNSSDQTPLVEAGKAGKTAVCKALLSHGGHVADMPDTELPLALAAAVMGQMMCGEQSK